MSMLLHHVGKGCFQTFFHLSLYSKPPVSVAVFLLLLLAFPWIRFSIWSRKEKKICITTHIKALAPMKRKNPPPPPPLLGFSPQNYKTYLQIKPGTTTSAAIMECRIGVGRGNHNLGGEGVELQEPRRSRRNGGGAPADSFPLFLERLGFGISLLCVV